MKNLKKLVSVVLALTMVISSMAFVSAKDFGDVDTSAAYYEAVDVLSDLAVLEGDEAGNFNPDAEIKRSEFAAVLCRALGQENSASGSAGATQFTDVSADHWAAGYINWAAAAKIVNGKGDGIFDPDAPVKYEEAIKMIVVALGYEPLAARKGGYPTGYQVVASSNNITKGISFSGSANAPRKDVARLVYQSLDVPLMDASFYSVSDEDEYVIYNGKNDTERRTVLSYYLGIAKTKATVEATAASKSSLAAKDGNDKAELKITNFYDFAYDEIVDGLKTKNNVSTVLAGDSGVEAYLAQEVIAYIGANEDDEPIIVSIVGAAKASDSLTVEENIEVMTATKDEKTGDVSYSFEYYENETDSYTEELEIDDNSRIFVNGVEVAGADNMAAAFNNKGDKVASVTFMDSEATGDYNMIFITEYVYAIVDSVKDEAGIIKLDAGSLDLTADTRGKTFSYTLALEDGTAIDIADLQKNDVLNILCKYTTLANVKNATDITKMDIIVSRNAVEGTVDEEVDAKKGIYAINSEEYTSNIGSLEVGTAARYLLSVDGKIVGEDEDWVSEEGSAAKNYGYVVAIGTDSAFSDVIYQIKMFTTDGAFVTYDVADKLYVYDSGKGTRSAALEVATEVKDGVTVASAADGNNDDQNDYIAGIIGGALADANEATAKANTAKRLIAYELNSSDEIKTIKVALSSSTSKRDLTVEEVATGSYSASKEKFMGKTFTSKSILISAPVKGTDSMSDWNVDEDDLAIASLDSLDEDATYAYAYLFDVNDDKEFALAVATEDLGTSSKTAMAVAYSVSTVSDGMEKVSFYQAGEFKSYVLSDDIAAGTIAAGDAFQYVVTGDEITKVTLVYDQSVDSLEVSKGTGTVEYKVFWAGAVYSKYIDDVTAGGALVDGMIDYTEGAGYTFAGDSEVGTVAMYNAARSGQNSVKGLGDLTSLYESSDNYNGSNAYAYKTIVRIEDDDVVDAIQYQIPVKTAFPSLK